MKKHFSTIIFLSLLFVVILTLFVIDEYRGVYVSDNQSSIKVLVTDLQGNAIQNAKISFENSEAYFFTDNHGYSPSIPLKRKTDNKLDWFTVTLIIKASSYCDALLFDCVIYDFEQRFVQIRLYNDDGTLPYVCYTETPPPNYIYQLLKEK